MTTLRSLRKSFGVNLIEQDPLADMVINPIHNYGDKPEAAYQYRISKIVSVPEPVQQDIIILYHTWASIPAQGEERR